MKKSAQARISVRTESIQSMSNFLTNGKPAVCLEAAANTSFRVEASRDSIDFQFSTKGLWGTITVSKSEAMRIVELSMALDYAGAES